jgi:hypothetical protein
VKDDLDSASIKSVAEFAGELNLKKNPGIYGPCSF